MLRTTTQTSDSNGSTGMMRSMRSPALAASAASSCLVSRGLRFTFDPSLRRTRALEALPGIGMADGGDHGAARQVGQRAQHAWPYVGRQVHHEAAAHHRIDAACATRRLLQVGTHVTQRRAAPAGHRQHRRRDVGTDHAVSLATKEAREDAGAAGRVQDEASRGHGREGARQGTLEQAEIQPPPGTPVATPLVALGVERAIAPARVVASGDGLGHHRETLTAAPASDKDRGEQAPGT